MKARSWTRGLGTQAVDAQASRRQAEGDGQKDAATNQPLPDTGGQPPPDHKGAGFDAEATTTERLTLAGHAGGQRVEDDRQVAETCSVVANLKGQKVERREEHEDAISERVAFERSVPLQAKASFWRPWVAAAVLIGIAIASAASVTGALQASTEDTLWLSVLMGVAFAGGPLASGAVVGPMVKRRELDDTEPGHWSARGLRWVLTVAVGVLGILALALAISGLRADASRIDAARRARDSQIELFVPGQGADQRPDAETSTDEGVDWLTWFLFEFGLAGAGFLVTHAASDPRVAHARQLHDEETRTRKAHHLSREKLAPAVGNLHSAILALGDHDASVILTTASLRSWARRLTNSYRHANVVSRAAGGDPFHETAPAVSSYLADAWVRAPGQDLAKLGTYPGASPQVVEDAVAEGGDRLDLYVRAATVLADAYDELSTVPARPEARATADLWAPGDDLALDAHVAALRETLGKAQGLHHQEAKEELEGQEQPEHRTSRYAVPEARVGGNGQDGPA